jgi:hypothetical protein
VPFLRVNVVPFKLDKLSRAQRMMIGQRDHEGVALVDGRLDQVLDFIRPQVLAIAAIRLVGFPAAVELVRSTFCISVADAGVTSFKFGFISNTPPVFDFLQKYGRMQTVDKRPQIMLGRQK